MNCELSQRRLPPRPDLLHLQREVLRVEISVCTRRDWVEKCQSLQEVSSLGQASFPLASACRATSAEIGFRPAARCYRGSRIRRAEIRLAEAAAIRSTTRSAYEPEIAFAFIGLDCDHYREFIFILLRIFIFSCKNFDKWMPNSPCTRPFFSTRFFDAYIYIEFEE